MAARDVLGHQLDIFGGETPIYAPEKPYEYDPSLHFTSVDSPEGWTDTGHPPLYHGSSRMFQRGELVLPPRDGSHNYNLSDQFDVFASSDPDIAAMYSTRGEGKLRSRGHFPLFDSVTQVAPRGHIFTDSKHKEKVNKSDYKLVGSPYGFTSVQTLYRYHDDRKFKKGISVGSSPTQTPPKGLTPPMGLQHSQKAYDKAYERGRRHMEDLESSGRPADKASRKIMAELDELHKPIAEIHNKVYGEDYGPPPHSDWNKYR